MWFFVGGGGLEVNLGDEKIEIHQEKYRREEVLDNEEVKRCVQCKSLHVQFDACYFLVLTF